MARADLSRTLLVLQVLLLLAACSATDTIDAVRLGPDRPAKLVLPTETCGDFFLATTYVNGAGPFAMLLDTGAGTTQIGLRAAESAGVSTRIREIDIGDLHVEGRVRCEVRDLDHLSNALGTEIDGILGHQVFRKVLLTYDYPAREIRVRVGTLTDDMSGIAPMSTSNRPYLGASLGDRSIQVLLDTGSSGGLSLSRFDEFDFQAPPAPVSAQMRIDGLHVVRAGRLAEDVRFGALRLSRPIVGEAVGSSLLGQAVLREYVVTIDQLRGRVRIVHPDGTAADQPVVTPRLYGEGWVVMPEKGRMVVRQVFAGSAAEAAGFRPGDILLAADGVLMADRGCGARLKRNDVPSSSTILVERDGEQFELELTTRVLVL